MASKILVVDGNEAFATMLRDMLERDGGYDVMVAPSGSDAMVFVERQEFDLVIVDMELDPHDMDYGQLVQNARSERPDLRLMLIPLMGRGLPPETNEWDIQGTLSKPFFADDLLPSIHDALSKQVSFQAAARPAINQPPTPADVERTPADVERTPADVERTPADVERTPADVERTPADVEQTPADVEQTPADVEQTASDIRAVLLDLERETRADDVLLLAGSDGGEGVVAHTGAHDVQDLESLSSLVTMTLQAAQAVARSLGQPDVPFEHNMFESGTQRLYVMTLPGDLVLGVVTPISTNLGSVRHNLRRAARELAALALT